MSDSPVPSSYDPGFSGHQPLHAPTPLPWKPAPASGTIDVFAVLRQSLADSTQSSDSILRATTDAARVLTGANGIALALRTKGAVVCRARSGEIAPALGSELNVDSGISGECFRSSKTLHCDDTDTDSLVDAEVCRALGIRSIVAVPLRGHEETVGILEAFSTLPHVFTDEQIGILQRLAEIAEATYGREAADRVAAPVSAPAVVPASVVAARQELITRPTVSGPPLAADGADESPRRTFRLYWILGAIAVFLVLVSAVAWMSWRSSESEVASAAPATQPAKTVAEPSGSPALAVIPFKPTAGHNQPSANAASAKQVLQNAAKVEAERAPAQPESSVRVMSRNSSLAGKSAVSNDAPELPPVVVAATESALLGNLASTPNTMPGLVLPISKGVTQAVLVHKVDPIYPAPALARRVEGSVVLEASISEDGAPHDLKVISGPGLLVAAAMDAVRQWRYRPTLLNGKPVTAQRQITVIFKTP